MGLTMCRAASGCDGSPDRRLRKRKRLFSLFPSSHGDAECPGLDQLVDHASEFTAQAMAVPDPHPWLMHCAPASFEQRTMEPFCMSCI